MATNFEPIKIKSAGSSKYDSVFRPKVGESPVRNRSIVDDRAGNRSRSNNLKINDITYLTA